MRAIGYYRQDPDGPAGSRAGSGEAGAETVRAYCREEFHSLIDLIGPEGAAESEQYGRLLAALEDLGRGGALVVIPDTRHLADDLETLVARLLELDTHGGEVRCADPEFREPLRNSLEWLGLGGRSPERMRRIRESVMSKAARGEVLGRTPYGFVAGLDGGMQVDDREAEVVRRVFRMYVGEEGGDSRGMGLRRIASVLNAEGLRTRAGNTWTPVALSGILRNRAYVGSYSRYGMRIVGNHSRIVDRELFNRVQQTLTERSQPRKKAQQSQRPSGDMFSLRSIARCAVCGRGMQGLTRSRSWTRTDGSTVRRAYRYYECPARAPRSRSMNNEDAEHPGWRASRLERAVKDSVLRLPAERLRDAFRPTPPEPGGASSKTAQREFVRAVRDAAWGRSGLRDLGAALRSLREARASYDANEHDLSYEDAFAGLSSDDPLTFRRSLSSFLDRAVVHEARVEPVLRSANERGVPTATR